MSKLIERSVAEHSVSLAAGEYSSVELTRAYLDAIKEKDGIIGAYVSIDEEGALRSAEETDKRRSAGEKLPACRNSLRYQVTTSAQREL